jgi:hypothetical protein
MIGSVLMTVGPAMAAKTLDGRRPGIDEETQQQILATLRQMLERMNVLQE